MQAELAHAARFNLPMGPGLSNKACPVQPPSSFIVGLGRSVSVVGIVVIFGIALSVSTRFRSFRSCVPTTSHPFACTPSPPPLPPTPPITQHNTTQHNTTQHNTTPNTQHRPCRNNTTPMGAIPTARTRARTGAASRTHTAAATTDRQTPTAEA